MNKTHLEQILEHYLENFDTMNVDPSTEWHKWKIAKAFPAAMDRALAAAADAFSDALLQVDKLTENLVDNKTTQPFYGLCKMAEQEPEEVRSLFRNLYADDGGDLVVRSKKIHDFVAKSNDLCERCFPGSFRYKNDAHAATTYLFLYAPDENYLYKPMEALDFSTYVEFYEDWGRGEAFHLDAYYRMCDQLVSAMQEHPTFLAKRQELWEQLHLSPEEMHPDTKHHILAVDLIYCCKTYGLFDGIHPKPRPSKKRKEETPQVDVTALVAEYREAERVEKKRREAEAYLHQVLASGAHVHHKKFGDGIIQQVKVTSQGKESVVVAFPNEGEKELGSIEVAIYGILDAVAGVPDFAERVQALREVLRNGNSIKKTYEDCRKNLQPYREELGEDFDGLEG